MKIWLTDSDKGISCGINDDGDLFIGNDVSGANMKDTPENREKIIETFCKYTNRQKPILNANSEPMTIDISVLEFSR